MTPVLCNSSPIYQKRRGGRLVPSAVLGTFPYINDIEEGVTDKIFKFADDTKLFTKTKEIGDKQKLITI